MSVSNLPDRAQGGVETVAGMAQTDRPGVSPVYSSSQLFGCATEIGIDHQGARYRLKITRQGKLILNK